MKRILALTLALTSCAEAQLTGNAIKKEGKNGSADVTPYSGTEKPMDPMSNSSSFDSETADTPKVVSGAFLHCSFISERSSSIELGCHFTDIKGKAIDAKDIAKSVNYELESGNSPPNKVTSMKMDHKDRLYDVLYRVKANTLADARKVARESKLRVSLNAPKIAISSYTSALISELLIDSNKVNNFRILDIDSNKKIVVDRISGAAYYRHSGQNKNWTDTVVDCEMTSIGQWKTWKMPTQTSLMESHEHGLNEIQAAREALDLARFPAWTASLSNTAADAYAYDANIYDAMIAFTPLDFSSSLAPSLCQH